MYEDFKIKLGKRIKEIRESKKLLREDVAFSAGFSGSYMGMIERAEYDFKISKLMIQNIVKLINDGFDIEDLIDRNSKYFTPPKTFKVMLINYTK